MSISHGEISGLRDLEMEKSIGDQIKDDLDCVNPEPRWPVVLAVLAIIGLRYALPPQLTFGPSYLMGLLVVPMLIPANLTHKFKNPNFSRTIGFVILALVTAFMVVDLGSMVFTLTHPGGNPGHKISATEILRTAAVLWTTNVLVFAIWYWRLDAGGPHARDLRQGHEEGAFFFPQMTMDANQKAETNSENWSPGFVDYLFLAFNTSTALSPADTSALSRWAKSLMMIQSLISLSIIVLLAARAVNILA